MFKKLASVGVCVAVVAVLFSATGCNTVYGPNMGIFSYPIPMSPFFQDHAEDALYEHERYERVPILGPITSGGPAKALDPPSEDEIMRALERAQPLEGGLPLLHEIQRNKVRIVVEPIADYIDPVRVYPMIGPAQQHHAHYKCIVYYKQTTRVGWPMPYTHTDEDAQEVIYIDHNHLHMVGNVDGGAGSNY
jgi:hypothetical protein